MLNNNVVHLQRLENSDVISIACEPANGLTTYKTNRVFIYFERQVSVEQLSIFIVLPSYTLLVLHYFRRRHSLVGTGCIWIIHVSTESLLLNCLLLLSFDCHTVSREWRILEYVKEKLSWCYQILVWRACQNHFLNYRTRPSMSKN